MALHKTEDAYALFRKHNDAFKVSDNFTTFIQLAGLNHLDNYIGGWIEAAFNTFKAGKETYRPLLMPNASKFSDLFTAAYFLPTDQKDKPEGVKFLGGNAGLCGHMGGTRGWSERSPDTRSHYGCKFYGTYVLPIEKINHKNTSFEAIRRTDGILIIIRSTHYVGEDWVALLDPDANIEEMFDEETRAFLAKERQAALDAWGS